MTTKAKFPGNTIQLSDTVDQWGRKEGSVRYAETASRFILRIAMR